MTDKKHQLHGEDDVFREPPAPFSLPPMPSLSSARPLTASTTSQAQSLYQDAHKLLETVLATPEPSCTPSVPSSSSPDLSSPPAPWGDPEPGSARWWRDVAAEAGRQLKAREEELAEARRQLVEARKLLKECTHALRAELGEYDWRGAHGADYESLAVEIDEALGS